MPVPITPVSSKQKKVLVTPIQVGDGVSATTLEANYAYFNDAGFTMFFKQGLTVLVSYDANTKIALKAFEDAAFAVATA